MDTAIVKKELDGTAWALIQSAAPLMHRSRLFGVANEEQAVAIMVKGYELGLGMSASFELIQVVEGKPTLIPRGALALAYQSGLIERLKITEIKDQSGAPYGCTVEGKRKGGMEYSITYTMDDARRADLVRTKSGWEKYPANMLKWRAIGFWIDTVLPDVQGGMKRADEMGAMVDEKGDIIDGSVSSFVEPEKVIVPAPTIEELTNKFGVLKLEEGLNGLFNGSLPSTEEDMFVLRDYLEAL